MPKQFLNTILIILIVTFAAVIRFVNIGKFGLYGDEKYSIMVVNGISWEGATQKEIFAKNDKGALVNKYFTPKQFWDLLTFSDFDEAIMRTDNGNSAAFYGLLYVWKSLFGQSDGTLRLMGVLFDCFTILLLFLFCKNILNYPFIGLLSAFFASIEPFMLAYSHQVRNYPVGIFLTLLSTYFFFKILKNETEKKTNYWFYLSYGLTVLFGILCHFYIVLFVFCQFIFLVIRQFNNIPLLRRFIVTYIVSFVFLGLWFTVGSGRNTYHTFKEKDEIFINMIKDQSDKSKEFANVSAATLNNIINKMGPILSDNFLFTNDIFWKFNGKLNFIFCLLLSGILLFFLDLSKEEKTNRKNLIYVTAAGLIMSIFYFVFSLNPLYYIHLSVVLVCLVVVVRSNFWNEKWQNNFLEFSLITLILPILLTTLAAFKSGHTANIYQKYLSFGLPIVFIFMAGGIYKLYNYKSYLAYLFILILGVYLFKIVEIDRQILSDNYPKYTIISKPRQPNPYFSVAEKIRNLYQPGDTIIYPNTGHQAFDRYDSQMKNDYVSVIDAQLTNIYLPKNAEYIQRVEPNEADKIVLYQLKQNRKIVIFDFEGNKFRY